MADRIALDATPLSLLCHPDERRPHVKEVREWLEGRLTVGDLVFIPEIADYETRRELQRLGRERSLQRLDTLHSILTYIPIDTAAMRRAAQI